MRLHFGNEDEAKSVISYMTSTIERRGSVTVGDVKCAIGEVKMVTFEDHRIGWSDISDATIASVGDNRVVLTLPRPILIASIVTDKIMKIFEEAMS